MEPLQDNQIQGAGISTETPTEILPTEKLVKYKPSNFAEVITNFSK